MRNGGIPHDQFNLIYDVNIRNIVLCLSLVFYIIHLIHLILPNVGITDDSQATYSFIVYNSSNPIPS